MVARQVTTESLKCGEGEERGTNEKPLYLGVLFAVVPGAVQRLPSRVCIPRVYT
jgi:hypothetical protein